MVKKMEECSVKWMEMFLEHQRSRKWEIKILHSSGFLDKDYWNIKKAELAVFICPPNYNKVTICYHYTTWFTFFTKFVHCRR